MVATRRRVTRGKSEKYEIGEKVEVSIRRCPFCCNGSRSTLYCGVKGMLGPDATINKFDDVHVLMV
jgi:hypothetical protein